MEEKKFSEKTKISYSIAMKKKLFQNVHIES